MTDIHYDPLKFGELMLYLAELSSGDVRYNRAKLAEQLFHCDFETCRIVGEPITGAVYRMQAEGPVADTFQETLARLTRDQRAVERKTRLAATHDRLALTAVDLADLTLFSSPEIDLVRSIVAYPPRRVGWMLARRGEVIPYPWASGARSAVASISR